MVKANKSNTVSSGDVELKSIIDLVRDYAEYKASKENKLSDEEALSRFLLTYESKDDKISYLDWELIPFKNTYRKTISIKDLIQVLCNRSNVKQYVVYSAVKLAIEKIEELELFVSKKGSLKGYPVPLPTMEDLADVMITTLFNSREIYSQMSFSRESFEGSTYSELLKPTLDTVNARMGKTLKEIKCAFNFYLSHDIVALYSNPNTKTTLDIPYLKTLLNTKVKELAVATIEGNIPVLILESTLNTLKSVKDGLIQLMHDNKCHVYIGKAGNGKTTMAISHSMNAMGNVVIALSNTVALNGMAKARTNSVGFGGSKDCVAASIQLTRMTLGCWKEEWQAINTFCIDEFSQWSMSELDVLLRIVNLCVSENKSLIIMGDVNQIPSFLGFGSLLHSIVSDKELGLGPNYLQIIREKEETTNDEVFVSNAVTVKLRHHRAKSSVNICEMNTKFLNDGDIKNYRSLDITLPKLLSSFSENPSSVGYGVKRMYVTGSNNQVMEIQRRVLENVMGRRVDVDFKKGILENLELQAWMVSTHNKIPVRCNETINMASISSDFKKATSKAKESKKEGEDKGQRLENYHKHKLIRNEQFFAFYGDNKKIHVESFAEGADGKPMKVLTDLSFDALCEHFDLNYAITVNKAQGLEWDNVIVVAGNLPKPEGVDRWANFNLTSNRESMYVSMSRFQKTGNIFIGDAGKYPIKRTKLVNNFDSVDYAEVQKGS